MAGRRPGRVGQRLHDAPAHAIRPRCETPDETDDDETRPPSPRRAGRQAFPIRGRHADLDAKVARLSERIGIIRRHRAAGDYFTSSFTIASKYSSANAR